MLSPKGVALYEDSVTQNGWLRKCSKHSSPHFYELYSLLGISPALEPSSNCDNYTQLIQTNSDSLLTQLPVFLRGAKVNTDPILAQLIVLHRFVKCLEIRLDVAEGEAVATHPYPFIQGVAEEALVGISVAGVTEEEAGVTLAEVGATLAEVEVGVILVEAEEGEVGVTLADEEGEVEAGGHRWTLRSSGKSAI